MATSSAIRQWALISLKLACSAGLIWFAFSKLDARAALALISVLPIGAALAALAVLFSEFVVAAVRLRVLLGTAGFQLRFPVVFDAVLIGAFFSQTLISFIGGDAMRIWRIVRNRVPIGNATRAVLYDRVFGFIGLNVLIVIGLPVLFNVVSDGRVHAAILTLIAASILGCLFLLSLHLLPARLRERRVFAFAGRIAAMGHDLLRTPRRLLLLVVISTGLQALNVVAIYAVARGLEVQIEFGMCLALIPPVMFLSMMPISFAGWGVREGAMVAALATVAVPASQALALSISYGLGLIVVSLPGGVLWLLARRPHPGSEGAVSG